MEKIKFDDLSEKERNLVFIAHNVRKRAYAPYSKYFVGAAVLTNKDNIYHGCNVESATYTQTTHAEQSAISAMVAAGERRIAALCCVGKEGGAPCGHCRQIIWEFCDGDPDVKIIGANGDLSEIQIFTIAELYPFRFGPEDLGI